MSLSEPVTGDLPAATSTNGLLHVSGRVTGYVGSGVDEDWFRVYLQAGTTYTIWMWDTSVFNPLDSVLGLYNNAGTLLQVSNEDGYATLDDAVLIFTPVATGYYFIAAAGYNDTGAYAISLDASGTAGDIAANASTAAVLAIGGSVSGSVGIPADADWYAVQLTAGVAYGFAVTAGTLPAPFVSLFDAAGNRIGGFEGGVTFEPSASGTYYLEISGSSLASTGSYTARAWVLPTVSIAQAEVAEGDSGISNLVFTLSLSSASPVPVSVDVATSGTSTATPGADYIDASSTVTFAPGQTSATFTVQVRGDTAFEPRENLYVALTDTDYAVIDDSNWWAWGLIADDDSPYVLPLDGYLDLQWYLYPDTGINAFSVWPEYTGTGVRVAVFDQGIDPNHPDLNGNLLVGLGRNASDLSAGGAPLLASDNHGTAVAGTIAAERDGSGIVGVAYGADLVSIYSPLFLSSLNIRNDC